MIAADVEVAVVLPTLWTVTEVVHLLKRDLVADQIASMLHIFTSSLNLSRWSRVAVTSFTVSRPVGLTRRRPVWSSTFTHRHAGVFEPRQQLQGWNNHNQRGLHRNELVASGLPQRKIRS